MKKIILLLSLLLPFSVHAQDTRELRVSLLNGNIDEASKLAERVIRRAPKDRIAHLVLGVRAIKQRHYRTARRELAQSARGPITDLTAALLTAWSDYGAGEPENAVAAIDKVTGADWYAIFKNLHAGMILDLAGRTKDAGKRLAQAYKLDSSALRVVEAYGSWLSRNKAPADALNVFEAFNNERTS